ncbi:MAG: hypothetical protein EZS28_048422, partial [Streblomastix strix]
MSNEGELYEVIADYGGDLADTSLVPVTKGEIVKVMKKDLVWCHVSNKTHTISTPITIKTPYIPGQIKISSSEIKTPPTQSEIKTISSSSIIKTPTTITQIKAIDTPSESTASLPPVDSTLKDTIIYQGYTTLPPITSKLEPTEQDHTELNTLQAVLKEPKVTYTPHKVPNRTSRKFDQIPVDIQLNQDIPPAPKLIHQDSKTVVQPQQFASDVNKTNSQTAKPESLVHKTEIQSPQIASNSPYNGRNSLKNAYTVSNLPHSPNNIQTPKDNSQV